MESEKILLSNPRFTCTNPWASYKSSFLILNLCVRDFVPPYQTSKMSFGTCNKVSIVYLSQFAEFMMIVLGYE